MSRKLSKVHENMSPSLIPSPLVGEGLGEGYFRVNTIHQPQK